MSKPASASISCASACASISVPSGVRRSPRRGGMDVTTMLWLPDAFPQSIRLENR